MKQGKEISTRQPRDYRLASYPNRVLLIVPAVEGDPFLNSAANLGVGYLGASLLARGHRVKLLDMANVYNDLNRLADLVKDFKPEVIGVTGSTFHYPSALKIIAHVKGIDPGIITIFGGPHASALAEFILGTEPKVDFIIRGEGEKALSALLQNLFQGDDLSLIAGLVYRDGVAIRANSPSYIEDLNELEYPWKIINPLDYQGGRVHGFARRQQPVAQVLSSRGCPYHCTFCAGRSVLGSKIRMRRPDAFLDELIYLKREYGIREVQIVDDNFTFYQDHAAEICHQIISREMNISLSLPNGVRADRLNEKLLSIMKKAGFYYLSFGIEFGSPRMLKLCRKSLDLDQARESIRVANKLGFMTQGFFLLGHPQERPEDIEMTRAFIKSVPLDRILLTLPFPLPGSELFDYYIRKRYDAVANIEWETFKFDSYDRLLENMTKEILRQQRIHIYNEFYFNPINALRFLSKFRTVSQMKSAFYGFGFLRKLLKS